jgi:hypothetical protein
MLTYDIIIKHLMPAINNFSLQSNIVMKSIDFPFFNNLFDDTFYRFGVGSSNSLINSINYCLSNDNKLYDNNINNIVKELDINIIIFDFKNNKIMMEYNDTNVHFFNPWKPTVYLANYDEWWEPIVCKDAKLFSFSSPKAHILKNNILNQNITRMNGDSININDNFNEIIDMEGFNKKSTSDISDDNEEYTNEAFIAPNISIYKPNKTQLNKMKKDELIELCKKLNKQINISKPTKKDLIDIICVD